MALTFVQEASRPPAATTFRVVQNLVTPVNVLSRISTFALKFWQLGWHHKAFSFESLVSTSVMVTPFKILTTLIMAYTLKFLI